MFDSKDLVAESSELIKIHKIEIFSEIAYAVFTLNEIFIYKGNQNKDLSTYTCIFKIKTVHGNMSGCKDHKGLLI